MPQAEAARLARQLKAAAEPVRLRILSFVLVHSGGEACVCDIVADLTDAFDLTEITARRHLAALREADLLVSHQRGAWTYYRASEGCRELLTRLTMHDRRHTSPGT